MRDRIAIIDINTKKFKAISYKQYDENNILQIVITENGNIIGLSNYSAVVKFQLPSGVVYKIPSIIENNTIKLILTRAILSEYGKVIVEIVLQDTKQLITTFSIYLNVEKSINNENSQLPEMDITSDYLHRHENKEVLDQITQEMIDSILEFEELLELDVYATKDYVQSEIEKIDINTDNLDLSNYYTKEEVDEKFENIDINTDNIDLSNYATKEELPTKASQLENDLNYLTSIPEEYVTETELNNKGYLTEHQDISGKADKTELFSKDYNDLINKPNIPSLDGYATENYVKNEIANAQLGGENNKIDLSGYATKDDLNGKANTEDIPTKVSQLENDSNYLTNIPSEYITETELNAKGYLTNIPEEYITETELNNKGYLTEHQDISGYATKEYVDEAISNIDISSGGNVDIDLSDYVTNDKLQEGLANKFDNVEVNEAETNDTQTALDFYANGKVVKTVYFTGGGGGNANTPPYVTLLSAEDNILGLGEVFNLELNFLSGVTGKGTLKVFINDIEVVSESIPQGENTIPITDDNFIKGNNCMTLYVIDRAGTMSNSVTLYVRYGSSEIVENEIARYTTSDGNTFPIFNSEFTYTHAITNSDGVYQYSIIADSMDNLPTRISFEGKGNLLTVEYFNIKNVTDMGGMFYGCINLTNLDVSNWDTSKVTNMGGMFQYNSNLTSLNLSGWDTSSVTTMGSMFQYCEKLTSLDVSGFITSNVIYMDWMFYKCHSLNSLDVSNFNTSKVTNMNNMFSECYNLTSLDVSNFDTSKVTNMGGMFQNCTNLTSLDVSGWDTSKVTDMGGMFQYDSKLTSLNLSSWDTSKVTEMGGMFGQCNSLTSLDSMMNISKSLSLSSTILDVTSLLDVIDNLATVTSTQTLTLGATLLAKLTEEQIAVATNKGWTIE